MALHIKEGSISLYKHIMDISWLWVTLVESFCQTTELKGRIKTLFWSFQKSIFPFNRHTLWGWHTSIAAVYPSYTFDTGSDGIKPLEQVPLTSLSAFKINFSNSFFFLVGFIISARKLTTTINVKTLTSCAEHRRLMCYSLIVCHTQEVASRWILREQVVGD